MNFYSPEQLKSHRIEIDLAQVSCDSPEVQNRLNRIQLNYDQLDSILTDLESRIESDERLKAIDDAEIDFDTTFGVKKKRKWRAAKPKTQSKSQSSASGVPKKPR